MEDYHKISDDADKINYDKLTQVAELTYRLVLRLANVEERIEKDELVVIEIPLNPPSLKGD